MFKELIGIWIIAILSFTGANAFAEKNWWEMEWALVGSVCYFLPRKDKGCWKCIKI